MSNQIPIGDSNSGDLPFTSEELNQLMEVFRQDYPQPPIPISDEHNRIVGAAMAGAAMSYQALGRVLTMFLCTAEGNKDSLQINLVKGFNRDTAPQVEKDLRDHVKSRGHVVFTDEIYYLALNRAEFEAVKMKVDKGGRPDLESCEYKKEGIMARLMTAEFEVCWVNPMVNKKLQGWRLLLDTRDKDYRALPLDIPLSCARIHKEEPQPESGDQSSFAM